jgi:hypothetical protein
MDFGIGMALGNKVIQVGNNIKAGKANRKNSRAQQDQDYQKDTVLDYPYGKFSVKADRSIIHIQQAFSKNHPREGTGFYIKSFKETLPQPLGLILSNLSRSFFFARGGLVASMASLAPLRKGGDSGISGIDRS